MLSTAIYREVVMKKSPLQSLTKSGSTHYVSGNKQAVTTLNPAKYRELQSHNFVEIPSDSSASQKAMLSRAGVRRDCHGLSGKCDNARTDVR